MKTPDQDPISVGSIALTVHDLPKVRDYYERVVGLAILRSEGESAILGAGGRPLLELRRDREARFRSPREAGLFHTAFLLPTRAALGGWLRHAIEKRTPVQGLSDHIVSEAIYLADPEGNGIEIYADRPRDSWVWTKGSVGMATDPMDVDGVLAGAESWDGAPDGTIVGHVHLQVGAIAPAEQFWRDRMGFDVTTHYPGASFFATGGYHHHLAANVWNSRNAGLRALPSTGLSELILNVRDPERRASLGETGLADPWGTPVGLKAG